MDKKLVVIFFQPSEGKNIVNSDYNKFFHDLEENEAFKKNGILVEHRICTHSHSLIQTIDELLNDKKCQEYYLHFSGHGSPTGIPFDGWEVANKSLEKKLNNPKIKFCFFSSCKSGSLAKEVSANNIPIVIGSGTNNLENQFAIKFQRRFYSYLAKKKSFHEAFDLTYVDFRENSNEDLRKQTLEWVHGEVLIRGEGAWDEIENGTKDLNSLQLISFKEEEDRHLIYPSIVEEFRKFKSDKRNIEKTLKGEKLEIHELEETLLVYARHEYLLGIFRKEFSKAEYHRFVKLFTIRQEDLKDLARDQRQIFVDWNVKIVFLIEDIDGILSDPFFMDTFENESFFEEGSSVKFAYISSEGFEHLNTFEELYNMKTRTGESAKNFRKQIEYLSQNNDFYKFIIDPHFTLIDKKGYVLDHFRCSPTHNDVHLENVETQDSLKPKFKAQFIRVFVVNGYFERMLNMIVHYLRRFHEMRSPILKYQPIDEERFSFEEALRIAIKESIGGKELSTKDMKKILPDILDKGHIVIFQTQKEWREKDLDDEIQRAINRLNGDEPYEIIPEIPTFFFFITSQKFINSSSRKTEESYGNVIFKKIKIPTPITEEQFCKWVKNLPRTTRYEVELFKNLDKKVIEKYKPKFGASEECPSQIIEKVCYEIKFPPSKVLNLP